MIARYTREKIGEIWQEENKFKTWLKVEIAVFEAKSKLKIIPREAVEDARQQAGFSIKRIEELEEELRHDMEAFINAVKETLPQECQPYFHAGLTSYDIEDTALAILLRDSLNLLIDDVREFMLLLWKTAQKYKRTLEIGRTHGVHAEPITFGFKVLNWFDEMDRNFQRLIRLKNLISVGKISGAVGIYGNLDPRIEKLACEKLELKPVKISTQIISRDRHAEYVVTLAIIAGTLEKIATEIRNLQRTEILEAQEFFRSGQKGSSAMPHKKNPVGSENICSLARMMRGYALIALENQLTWHERDLTNSGNERIILADSSILLDYMLNRLKVIVADLQVDPRKMKENLQITKGVIFSQQVMLALAGKGMAREDAHNLAQEVALKARNQKKKFKTLLLQNRQIRQCITEEEINECLDPQNQFKYIDELFRRFGL